MVFRIDEQGIMYEISIPYRDEDRFLKAQEGGKLEYIKVNYEELPKYDGDLRLHKLFYKRVEGKIEIDFDRTIAKWIKDKYKEIENVICSKYSQSKQSSDVADKNYYETLLKAKGIQNLEADIVVRAKRFFEGESLEDVVADVADKDKEAYTQLLKVAIRVEWVQQCKAELKAAIAEEREPQYPEYPL